MKFADAGMADKKLRLEQFLFVQSSGTGSGAGTAGEKGRSLEMKVFVVVYHPEASSFNQAMFRCAVEALAAAGHEVRSSDLAAMGFDPRPGNGRRPGISGSELELCADPVPGGAGTAIEEEIGKIEWCDLMIWQFPLWWFGLPSTFKGWVERCFVQGRIYGGGRFYAEGRFHGRRAMLSLTTGGSEELYRPGGANGDIDRILYPIHHGMLEFIGFEVLAPNIVFAPERISDSERGEVLVRYRRRLAGIEREVPVAVPRF